MKLASRLNWRGCAGLSRRGALKAVAAAACTGAEHARLAMLPGWQHTMVVEEHTPGAQDSIPDWQHTEEHTIGVQDSIPGWQHTLVVEEHTPGSQDGILGWQHILVAEDHTPGGQYSPPRGRHRHLLGDGTMVRGTVA